MKSILLLFFLILGLYCLQIDGIDVSAYQKIIDWETVAKSKKFVIIRAGYGKGIIDKYWESNYKGAKAAGLKVGAYWHSYAKSKEDAKQEARGFVKALKGKQLEWPVYYNIDESSIFNKNIQNDIAKLFCKIMEVNKYYCGIYSRANYLLSYFNSDIRTKYTIWVSYYGSHKPGYSSDYGIWHKGIGKINGINEDFNIDIGYIDFEPIIKKGGYNGFSADTPTTKKDGLDIIEDRDEKN